ncbi:MAG: hypothetical protein NDJ24_06290 [Alphaproteobacteria bacterium]|nr:hypothetical protein [Alphaproteobacteria bacterium]
MIICSCNSEDEHGNRFNEKAVARFLEKHGDKTVKVKEIYAGCTGGKQPQCGSCICTLKDEAQAHNNRVTIQQLKSTLPESVPAAAPTKRVPHPAGSP